MLELVPDVLENYLSEADAARDRSARDLYPLRLLDITRQARAAVPLAKALLLDLSTRWDKPIGPIVTAVRSDATTSALSPPPWLEEWRSPHGEEWQMVRARAEQHLAYALGFGEPEDLGWTEEDGEWRVDLLDPVAVQALTTFQQAVHPGTRRGEPVGAPGLLQRRQPVEVLRSPRLPALSRRGPGRGGVATSARRRHRHLRLRAPPACLTLPGPVGPVPAGPVPHRERRGSQVCERSAR
ncbi:hypothetical protein [Actinokineospora cianjurensis]|uniref:Uncharacterized protein n=1 Tax=Actinokineospora cianjurensis TaxID=585224 RepID=A0A421B2E0_9PSEU|nr:hypothetical protein [Actinokineospora cianjurensis]RLK58443.1 hypothetical protein CLV68_4547 [Actinokineospora cianjurensis]